MINSEHIAVYDKYTSYVKELTNKNIKIYNANKEARLILTKKEKILFDEYMCFIGRKEYEECVQKNICKPNQISSHSDKFVDKYKYNKKPNVGYPQVIHRLSTDLSTDLPSTLGAKTDPLILIHDIIYNNKYGVGFRPHPPHVNATNDFQKNKDKKLPSIFIEYKILQLAKKKLIPEKILLNKKIEDLILEVIFHVANRDKEKPFTDTSLLNACLKLITGGEWTTPKQMHRERFLESLRAEEEALNSKQAYSLCANVIKSYFK